MRFCIIWAFAFVIGMAMGRVWARFLHNRTRLVGQDPRPGLSLFTKRIFFSEARTRPYRVPQTPLSLTRKEAFLKQALNSTSNPWPNNQSQKSLLFKSPKQHPYIKKNNNNKNPIFIFQSSNPEITKPTEEILDQTKNKYKEEDKNRNGERRKSWP